MGDVRPSTYHGLRARFSLCDKCRLRDFWLLFCYRSVVSCTLTDTLTTPENYISRGDWLVVIISLEKPRFQRKKII